MPDENQTEKVHQTVIALCDQRKYAEAIKTAQGLLSSDHPDTDQAEGLAMLGYIASMQKQLSEALSYRAQATAKNPTNAGIRYSYLGNLIECGHYAEAIASADREIALDEDSEWRSFTDSARFCKAYALYKLGRLDEATNEFAEVEDGEMWIDGRLTTKAAVLDEIARAKDRNR
jgi:tetratricopeptide (TPR) repeat protein